MPHHGEIDKSTRSAIIAMRCEGRGWTYISRRVANCSPYGVQRFFERVLNRAGVDVKTPPTELNLPLLLTLVDDDSQRGRPELFEDFSAVANALVNNATKDEKHKNMSYKQVARITEEQLGVRIPYTTAERIFCKQEIVKKAPLRKIRLN